MDPAELLFPLREGHDGLAPRDVIAGLRLREERPPAGRPRVAAVMIAAPDGRASIAGRSGGLGVPADRALLRESRAVADALLVGVATLRTERYGNVLDEDHRAYRATLGLDPSPRIVTVSRDLARLPVAEARIFAEPDARVTVFTESSAEEVAPPPTAAALDVVRLAPGALTLEVVLADLWTRCGVRLVVTEGGPTLLRELAAAGLLDDLILTLAPFLIAGAGTTLLHGPEILPPATLHLGQAHRAGDHLFLHYRVEPA